MLSLITWIVTGIVFGIFWLPIPAPQVFEWILGIVGIWVWFMIIKTITEW